MDKLVIEGGKKLKGEVRVSGSKNSTLPILAATLLTDDKCVIRNVPKLRDTLTMIKLLRSLGKTVDYNNNTAVISGAANSSSADYKLVSTMRGSFCVMGPLLAKFRTAKVSLPGGCVIGIRPVDLHIKGFQALGAGIEVEGGYVIAKAKQLKGDLIYLGGMFGPSVLATDNVMMAASLATGETIIESAACEPEVEELTEFLIKMGAKIEGKGTPRLVIHGVKKLHGAEYDIGPDRIEAGTFVLLAAATGSTLTLRNVNYSQLLVLMDRLEQCGVKFKKGKDSLTVTGPKKLKPVSVTTYPYPGFPTDLQAQFMALMSITPGISIITDKVFPDRFMHIAELNRMGANIRRDNGAAIVEGVRNLFGAPVMASDLRASAALVLAGLVAKGKTEIHRIYHLERGYENIDEKLKKLGAKIYREKE
ncbi:MAG: UDP-N-acetylglucosamine 1-carboxyvinyltransferase [Candidatus Omnitrophica bacterium]|nr:UDP-N-acetylglucosamine 1-carboxyvinyltransferase [Candidatus Omnitrophota bacterium]